MAEGEPENAENTKESRGSELNSSLETIQATNQKTAALETTVTEWQTMTGLNVDQEQSEFGFPVLDLRDQDPGNALDLLGSIQKSQDVVFHGMHNNEFRRDAGMPDVGVHDSLDPAYSHQDNKAVYATKALEGGLTHAVLEHKVADQDPVSGETYAIRMNQGENGQKLEVSSGLASALESGESRFTDGILYVLPASEFSDTPNSDHEVMAREKVRPIAVFRVGKNLGPAVVNPGKYTVRQSS